MNQTNALLRHFQVFHSFFWGKKKKPITFFFNGSVAATLCHWPTDDLGPRVKQVSWLDSKQELGCQFPQIGMFSCPGVGEERLGAWMPALWEPRGPGLPHSMCKLSFNTIFIIMWCSNPDPLSLKLFHNVKPELLLAWWKGSGRLVVSADFLPTVPSSATPHIHAFKGTCAWISFLLAACPPSPTLPQQATGRQGSKSRKEGAPTHKATQPKERMDSQDEGEAEPGTEVLPGSNTSGEPGMLKHKEALRQQGPRPRGVGELGRHKKWGSRNMGN